jgi:hypothetical protein
MNLTPLWSVLIRQKIGFAYSITNMVRFCGRPGGALKETDIHSF